MTGFALRAPWYERERLDLTLGDHRAHRPAIQKFGGADFATRMLEDPRDSLAFLAQDRWSYPVPISPTSAHGRERFATHRLHYTHMRKLFQPTHDRFYTVAVEVFCDEPGLPRAGRRDDFEVGFVMRRRRAKLVGDNRELRRLARDLIAERAKQCGYTWTSCAKPDSPELYLAEHAWKQQFAEDHGKQLAGVDVAYETDAWMVNADGGVWRPLDDDPPVPERERHEEQFRMWRLPDSAALCEAGKSRSVWFGVVPTYSAEHWIGPSDGKQDHPLLAKLDDHEIYELVCFVKQRPDPLKPDCPPKIWWSEPTRAFRLAAPFDPEGTQNHAVTITAPDLRRLAARAGQKLGPGGARIVTPPGSGLPPPPFGDLGKSTNQAVGAGGSVCFFAFELFFLVALFLFLLFLPIIVFLFQLWWMLALKFCIPPSASFQALVDFLADGGDLPLDPAVAADKIVMDHLDKVVQLPSSATQPGGAALLQAVDPFKTAPTAFADLVAAIDPENSAGDPAPPPPAATPDDPLCPKPATPP